MTAPLTVCEAAILDHDGTIYSVPRPGRHHDVIRLMADTGCKTPVTGKQGFVLSDGFFADRRFAAEVAIRAGQVKALSFQPYDLFSEDLW